MTALYIDSNRKKQLDAGFFRAFGKTPGRYFSAPGRTEIGGNHTDHQRGRVLAAAVDVGYLYLQIMSGCLPVLYILHVVRSAIQGMGDTVLPMVSGIAEFIMRAGSVFLLTALMGPTGTFVAEVLAWLGADLILIPSYFITIRKVEKRLKKGEPL